MFGFLDGVAAHWVFLAVVLVINALVSITKRVLSLVELGQAEWFILHAAPIAFGIAIAAIPGVHVKGVDGFGARALFFVGCGLASAYLYRLAVQFARKNGYTLESITPPEK